MNRMLTLLALIAIAVPALALDVHLSRDPAPKPDRTVTPALSDGDVLRQGGDTIIDAVPLVVPASLTGSTLGYNDDYDEVCPYASSTSPDVVYSLVPEGDLMIFVDLFGSTYDTKVYVYDADLNLIGCNDDYYADYTSRLQVILVGGVTYYIVIDGYGGDAGDYVLDIYEDGGCELQIPADAVPEGEPPLENGSGVLDCHNGGCQFVGVCPDPLWQFLGGDQVGALAFHGRGGWYADGDIIGRDTDWFEAVIGPTGVIEIDADATQPTYLFELGPLDCNTVGVLQDVPIGPCIPDHMTITGEPGAVVWIWVGAQSFEPPYGITPYEYDYLLEITGLESGPVATEARSWTDVKSLYR